jgi:hypothetical protein
MKLFVAGLRRREEFPKKICSILSLANLQRKYFQSTFHILSIVPDHLDPYHYGNHWKAYDLVKKGKAVPLHAMEALGGRGDVAPTHLRPRQ